MLTAVVTHSGEVIQARVVLPHAEEGAETTVQVKESSPIAPEPKELIWGGGAFVVFFVLMRVWLFPRVKQGMDARYALIRSGHDDAAAARTGAKSEVAEYRAQLAEVKAEVALRTDAARQQVEQERQARLAEVNADIAERRSAAVARAAADLEAARDQVGAAVAAVAERATELAIGTAPDAGAVRRAVDSVMSVGAR